MSQHTTQRTVNINGGVETGKRRQRRFFVSKVTVTVNGDGNGGIETDGRAIFWFRRRR